MGRSMIATEPLPSSTPSSSAWTLALRISQRVPTTRVSYRTTRPRTNGHLARVAVDAGIEAFGGEDDPAVRVTEGDGDRVAAAHQVGLDEGLATVGVWAMGEVYPGTQVRPGERRWGRLVQAGVPAAGLFLGPRHGQEPEMLRTDHRHRVARVHEADLRPAGSADTAARRLATTVGVIVPCARPEEVIAQARTRHGNLRFAGRPGGIDEHGTRNDRHKALGDPPVRRR